MSAQTTATLTDDVKLAYEAKYLSRAKHILIHKEGLQSKTVKKGDGKVVRFTKYTPLATATTPLTEGSNPSEVDFSTTTVDASLAEYGNVAKISKRLSLVSIDTDGAEKADVMGQNMAETLDELTRNALYSGATAQLANGKAALSDLSASDTFDSDEVRKAVRTLKKNKARRYKDGFFLGKIGPDSSYDLMGDSTWVNAKVYSDVQGLYMGEIGKLHGVRFLETTNQKSEASTVTVYSNFIHGEDAAGVLDLEKDMPKLYVKVPGPQDTSNPTDRYSTMGWAGSFVAKTLIATWIINVKSGVTA